MHDNEWKFENMYENTYCRIDNFCVVRLTCAKMRGCSIDIVGCIVKKNRHRVPLKGGGCHDTSREFMKMHKMHKNGRKMYKNATRQQ